MDRTTLLLVVVAGGLLGLFAQGLRAAIGLIRFRDAATDVNLHFGDHFTSGRLIVNLLIGFSVGILAAWITGIERLSPFGQASWIELAWIVTSSYAVTDVVDRFLTKLNFWKQKEPPASTDEILKVLLNALAARNSPPPTARMPRPYDASTGVPGSVREILVGGASLPAPAAPVLPPMTASFLYATNRRASSDESYFSGERSDEMSYGTASVQIPESHKIGKIELPFKLSLLSFTFYEERLDPQKHFTIKSVDIRPVEDWMKLVSQSGKSSALVFVHGFNTTFRNALYRAGQIFWDLQYQGIPVLFSWPSRGAILDYVYDRDSAYGARDSFIEVLRRLRSAGANRIDILAHSMGNLVVLEALAGYQHARDPLGIAEILMAAPDVDINNYKKIAAKVKAAVPGMTLYASSADRALVASKKVSGNVARAGDVPGGRPVLVDGIDAIDVTEVGEELFGLGHSAYAGTVSLLNDISILITQGTRPPSSRLPVEIGGMPMGQIPPSWWRVKPR